jgi:spore germination protein YaaH
MVLQRSLHFVAALLLVTGMSAVTETGASAATNATTASSVQQAPQAATAAASTRGSIRVKAPVAVASPSVRREVFGFGLASSLSDPTVGYPSWNFSLLTTVAFFGLHINWDGTIVGDSGLNVWNSSALTGLLSTAHASGTKVVLTIVLQDFAAGTPNMCAGLINRSVTVQQAVAQVTAKGVDGLNVDYEGLNGTCQNGQTAQAMMTDFVRQLRGALPAGSYLSVDTYASSAADSLGFFDIPGLSAYADSFFVMAYDLEYSNYHYPPLNCVSFCLGPTAPLTGYHYNDTTTASQYAAAVPASKVILGVPYYGRKSCVGGVVPNAYPTGSVTADSYLDASGESSAPGVGSYATHRDATDPSGQERWDTWFNSSINCTRELYWDDATSLGAKYDLVNADNLRGVGIWTLNYGGGAPELWAALSSHFVACTAAGLSVSPPSQAAVGTRVTVTAGASGCPDPSPLYQFWILTPNATSWQMVQAYSTNASFIWDTTGAAASTYSVAVWVRDSRSQGVFSNSFGRWDASTSVQYTLYSSPCSAVGLTISPTPPASGVGISVIATASGCPNPLYQFWLLAPGATSYQMVQAYSSNPTWQWNTSGAPTGVYVVAIWARDTNSAGTTGNSLGRWDAGNSVQYTTACSAVTLTSSPPGAAPLGTVVTISAQPAGCANPLYQFWILTPGAAAWQMVQAYSTSPTWQWNTRGAAAGTYAVAVWARDSNSTGTSGNSFGRWDAFYSSQYSLSSSACSTASVSSAPPASTVVGTTVTISAGASGCANPSYQFWILTPGAAGWQMVQAYSAGATWRWNTSGAPPGNYVVAVWALDSNSTGTFGNSFGRWDAFGSGQYTLSSNACSSATVSSAPAGSAKVGTAITITAHAAGCANPSYQFWILTPGASSWQMVQAYSTSATFQWNSSGAKVGTYVVAVWAQDSTSTGTFGNSFGRWDSYGSSNYTLT